MALGITGNAANTFSGNLTGTVTLTTSSINNIILVAIGYESSVQRNVTSVTASGLTFVRRWKKNIASSNKVTAELWWAASTSALTSKVITVNLDANIDDCGLVAFGVEGASSLTDPFDTNAGLPFSATASGLPPAVTYSTTTSNCILLGFGSADQNIGGWATQAGWTLVNSAHTPAGVVAATMGVDRKIVATPQTSQSYTPNTGLSSGGGWVSVVDAITADNTAPVAYNFDVGFASYTVTPQNIGGTGVHGISIDTAMYTVTPGQIREVVDQFRRMSFSSLHDETFTDWASTGGGAEFDSYFSVCQSLEDPSLKTQTPYVYTFLREGTADSDGAFMRADWNWITNTDAEAGSPYSQAPEQVYVFRNGLLLGAKKTRVRGKGRSIHLKFTSDARKNFNILGWTVFYDTQAQQ